MLELAHGWHWDVDLGPDCLFVRIKPSSHADHSCLAESLWLLLRQHFANRLVLELDDLPMLTSELVGQLMLLQKQVHTDGGLLRLCGLSEEHHTTLRCCQLTEHLPSYHNREAAVMGNQPALIC